MEIGKDNFLPEFQCSPSRPKLCFGLQREVIISYTAFYCNFEIEVNQFYTKSLAVQQFNNIGMPKKKRRITAFSFLINYILNDAMNYIDLIYKYSFQNGNDEEVKEWFKIKDVILLSNLHYIKNQRDAYMHNCDSSNIDYKKILNILNDYQKYIKRNSTNYNLTFFDFENEIDIKQVYQLNRENNIESQENEKNVYYCSCYYPNGKMLKLETHYNNAENSNLSVFAVIHNLLIRTRMIPKTDYLLKMNLSEQELNSVYYFQMIILNAIKSGDFLINQKNKIAVNKTSMEYVKIALNNLNYYINLFNHLMKEKVEELKYTIAENNEKGININEKNFSFEIVDEQLNYIQPIWISKRIEYIFSQDNKIHYEKIYVLSGRTRQCLEKKQIPN